MGTPQKTVMVTGVSSGFGKAIAEYLSQKGYQVYGTSRHRFTSNFYEVIQMDLTKQESIEGAVAKILEKEERIDVLINNAGMGIAGAVEDSSMEEIKLQFETNFFSWVKLTQLVLPLMRLNVSGFIVNISSIAGLVGLPFQAFYSSSKFAMEGFAESLRLEVQQFNIKVVNINPGDYDTNFSKNRLFVSKSSDKNGPYTNQFSRTMNIYEQGERKGADPGQLARLVYKVINTKQPKFNYLSGRFMDKLSVYLKRNLPASWFYGMLSDHFKI